MIFTIGFLEELSLSDAFVTEHVVFTISQVETGCERPTKAIASKVEQLELHTDFEITAEDFAVAFPYHICFDRELFIKHIGQNIQKTYPMAVQQETKVTDIFELVHPEVPFSYDSILAFKNSLFVFKMKEDGDIVHSTEEIKSILLKVLLASHEFPSRGYTTNRHAGDGVQIPLFVASGSMILVDEGKSILYMASVYVTTVRELLERNLHISDIQRHDGTRDLIMLNQSRISQVELNRKLEETTKNLKKMASELEVEKRKTDELLCELMPASIADALRQGKTIEANDFPSCTLLFTDIVTFTNICAKCTPHDVVSLLNDLYLRFDRLIELHGVYKVETIGDAYMVVGGVPDPCDNHSERVLNVSIESLSTRLGLSIKCDVTKEGAGSRV
ncbi:heme NO binding associated [Dictyocaulus viviparus]|uniref:guanylate cyclase n=1 Tax=Dictyocaulus viviparus TaxID=29172 RepID=A0A0D8XCA9_DICVI|nr:heme NO binding associated [Dictyocaulus viviparus]